MAKSWCFHTILEAKMLIDSSRPQCFSFPNGNREVSPTWKKNPTTEAQVQVQQWNPFHFFYAIGAKCLCQTEGIWEGASDRFNKKMAGGYSSDIHQMSIIELTQHLSLSSSDRKRMMPKIASLTWMGITSRFSTFSIAFLAQLKDFDILFGKAEVDSEVRTRDAKWDITWVTVTAFSFWWVKLHNFFSSKVQAVHDWGRWSCAILLWQLHQCEVQRCNA